MRPTKEILSRVDVQVLWSTWLLVRVYIPMQTETYFKKWCFNKGNKLEVTAEVGYNISDVMCINH